MDLKDIPDATRPIVQAARKAVKAAAPGSKEIAYNMAEPQSARTMWKLFRYQDGEGNVCGVGTFPNHANTRLGTVGFLDIDEAGRVVPSILDLTDV